MGHLHKHIQVHLFGTLRPRLIPAGYAGQVAIIPMQVTWGDTTPVTWGNGVAVEWSNS